MAQSNWDDYYALLDLYDPINQTGKGPNSTDDEIRSAWKLQISAWHPDKFQGAPRQKAEDRTKRINAAYDLLRDPAKKKVYDAEWLKKNSWFQSARDANSAVSLEIAVRWDPPDALTNVFFNIPRGEKRTAKLIIEPRVGRGFSVTIEEPASGWLKVLEPRNRQGIPPFTAVIEVDTTNLQPEHLYDDDLVFVLEDS